jgi:large conductance mechanosensitive channel
MLKEFREFVMRGNVVDLAVAVVIGGAFGAIVASFVKDVLMPPVGLLVGGMDFSNLFVVLGPGSYPSLEAAKAAGAATLNYGVFLNTVVNFLIVALAMFAVVKVMSGLRRAEAPAPATTKACPFCCSAIPLAATRCPACTSSVG